MQTSEKSQNLLPRKRGNWEVDWSHPENTGTQVWARNLSGHLPSAREWHWTKTGYLRASGVNTATYRKDSWEIDWSKRNGKMVWGRNEHSKMPAAREWHWVENSTLKQAGVQWKPARTFTGRCNAGGYVSLTRRAMTAEEIELAEKFNLFGGQRNCYVMEHRLVAVKKFGQPLDGLVVRHLNGVKNDNDPINIVTGTTRENTLDHVTARMELMVWRHRYEQLAQFIQDRGLELPADQFS